MNLIRPGTAIFLFLLSTAVAMADCRDCTTLDFNKEIQLNLLTPMLDMNLKKRSPIFNPRESTSFV